jgi:hypothetical protein
MVNATANVCSSFFQVTEAAFTPPSPPFGSSSAFSLRQAGGGAFVVPVLNSSTLTQGSTYFSNAFQLVTVSVNSKNEPTGSGLPDDARTLAAVFTTVIDVPDQIVPVANVWLANDDVTQKGMCSVGTGAPFRVYASPAPCGDGGVGSCGLAWESCNYGTGYCEDTDLIPLPDLVAPASGTPPDPVGDAYPNCVTRTLIGVVAASSAEAEGCVDDIQGTAANSQGDAGKADTVPWNTIELAVILVLIVVMVAAGVGVIMRVRHDRADARQAKRVSASPALGRKIK